jgi:hypothetical protein
MSHCDVEQNGRHKPVSLTINEVAVKIDGGSLNGQTLVGELPLLEIVIYEVQGEHNITMPDLKAQALDNYQPGHVYFKPNLKFLLSLAARINEYDILVEEETRQPRECTATIANAVWREVLRLQGELKKSTDFPLS